MRCALLAVLPFAIVVLLVSGCGTETPDSVLKDADTAFRTDKDYTKAIELYESVLDWKGEGEPSKTQRFNATLEIIRCRIAAKDYEQALKDTDEMCSSFADTVVLKDLTAIIGEFLKQGGEEATDHAITVIGKATEMYPDQKDQFKKWSEKIMEDGATSEQMKRLKQMGYL